MPARLTTAAMEWAAKAMSRAVGLTVRQQAFNPSAVDRSNVLLRVEPLCKWYDFNARSCGTFADMPRNSLEPRERLVRAVWLRDGVVERGVAGSDPRGVWLNRHTLLAIYSNWATFWRDDPKTKLPKHAFVVMVAQNLSDPRSAPVPLWLAGLRQAAWEKNWMPFRPQWACSAVLSADAAAHGSDLRVVVRTQHAEKKLEGVKPKARAGARAPCSPWRVVPAPP